ncbi:MAG: ATP-binding domain-containing protein [Deltaproteobacteria bacterium]|nr:ATP-binding domain-containing protein [Deltaproteobacteria bacterium]
MARLTNLDPNVRCRDFAVVSRSKTTLAAVRSLLEEVGYPFRTMLDTGFPFHRVREIETCLTWLAAVEQENLRASELKTGLLRVRDNGKMNVWWQLIEIFLEAYREETADSIQPVSWAIDRLYEFLSEKSREKVLGHGIFMSTIHSAKGMEFPHVFVLDGDWRHSTDNARWEEERRVMYVGMTRAEETLRLLRISKKPNPFLKEIRGDCVMPFTYQGRAEGIGYVDKSYEIMGLSDIYLDYAGCFPQGHAIHTHLAKIETGEPVSLCRNNAKLEIRRQGGECLGRLSNEGANRWRERLDQILAVRVVAMVQRNRDDPDEPFQDRIKADRWEIPVLEIVSRAKSSPYCRI